MSYAFEQSPWHVVCVGPGRSEAQLPVVALLWIVIVLLILMGTPPGDITALITAVSLLITQASSRLSRNA